jgi:hypothetical protein
MLMKSRTKAAIAASAAVGVSIAASRNPDTLAAAAAFAASDPNAIMGCHPAMVYAADKYYGLKAALRH